MTADAERVRYADYVRTRVAQTPFISRAREGEILEDGHKFFQLQTGEARWIFYGVARESGAALEADLDRWIDCVLVEFADERRRIGKDDFEKAAAIYERWAGDEMSDDAVRKKLKRRMTDLSCKPAGSGLVRRHRWFRKI